MAAPSHSPTFCLDVTPRFHYGGPPPPSLLSGTGTLRASGPHGSIRLLDGSSSALLTMVHSRFQRAGIVNGMLLLGNIQVTWRAHFQA